MYLSPWHLLPDVGCPELFDNIRKTLDDNEQIRWSNVTSGMIRVRNKSKHDSAIIAYLGTGAKTDLISKQGNWGKIKLMENHIGFVPMEYLELVNKSDQ